MTAHSDFRIILRREFETRSRKNPRYSLRAFARDAGLSPSRLSEVLTGKCGLSLISAQRISRKLGWNSSERDFFCSLVESKHSRSPIKRKLASDRLDRSVVQPKILDADQFRVVSDWYHYAILELTYLSDFQSDSIWIAKRLGIQTHLVEAGIERLLRLGLLRKDGTRLFASDEMTETVQDVPSQAIRGFHDQILSKAQESIYSQSTDRRELNSLVVSVSRSRLREAKERIRAFNREFTRDFGNDPTDLRDAVYCMAIQLFDLTNETAQPVKRRTGSKNEKRN